MNKNALNDEIVRQQVWCDKAAFGDQGDRLKFLVENYENVA